MAKVNVKVFIGNGNSYLGTKTDNVVVGMRLTYDAEITRDNFADYLKANQMEELVTVEVGLNSTVTIRDLTRREKLDYDMVLAEFKEAKSMSSEWLVNKVFDEFRSVK